jgi:hypothetical protein
MIAISIIGIDRFTAGYMAAKKAHEKAMLSGPIPVYIVRAAQFHEFVGQIMEWGRQGGVSYVPKMRTQLVAARSPRHSPIWPLTLQRRAHPAWARRRFWRSQVREKSTLLMPRYVWRPGVVTRSGSKQ